MADVVSSFGVALAFFIYFFIVGWAVVTVLGVNPVSWFDMRGTTHKQR